MKDNIIITPYYYDEHIPELISLPYPSATLNTIVSTDDDPKMRMADVCQPIADFVHQSLVNGQRPVSISGECCAAIPVLAGLQRANIDATLIWIDAHGDFNTEETSPTGFLGGMPLAMIAGLGDQSICESVGLKTQAQDKIILTDARDLDPKEAELVENSNLTYIDDFMALMTMELPEGPVYVHFDTDIISSDDAPAFSHPTPGGPNAVEVTSVMKHLRDNCEVVTASMSTWLPRLDKDGKTQEKCVAAFNAVLE